MVVRKHGGDTGLLEHDFRYPDAVGIAAGAPGKVSAVCGEPVEQCGLKFWEGAGCEVGFHVRVRARAILAWRRRFSLGDWEAGLNANACAGEAAQKVGALRRSYMSELKLRPPE